MNNIILIALRDEAPELAQYSNVFFTGVGKINAAMVATDLIMRHQPKKIFNFGTAGGITVSHGLHQVGKFVQRDMLCTQLGYSPGQTPYESTPATLEFGTGLTCSSGDNFVADPALSIPADLVDMEAYAIARVCYQYQVDFACYKFVSDAADNTAADDWQSQVSSGQAHYISKLRELAILI